MSWRRWQLREGGHFRWRELHRQWLGSGESPGGKQSGYLGLSGELSRDLTRMLKNYTSSHSSVQNLHFNRDFPVQGHTHSSPSLPYNTLLLPMKPQADLFSCLSLSLHIYTMGGLDLVTTKHPRCSDIQGYFIHSFLLINELLIISIYVPGPLLGTGDPGVEKKDLIKDPHNNPHI